MSKETLKLALEALDMMIVPRSFQAQVRIKEIYETIEAELASEQEQPTVRTGNCLLTGVCASEGHKIQLKRETIKWVGLSVEDIDKAIENNQRLGGFRKVGFAYDLEQVLKEKNT
jgi:hypothetical protein